MRFAAIIRIGHRLALAPWHMIEQQRELGPAVPRPHPPQAGEIVAVHRDDMVEAIEILGPNLACPQMVDGDAVARRHRPRPPVGRLAGMPVAGAGGIGLDLEAEPLRLGTKRRFGERRAADIAQADEQHAGLHR